MDLEDDERYAAAALYTLALHLVQTEFGQHGDPDTAWGEPPDDDDVAVAAAAAQAAAAASSSSAPGLSADTAAAAAAAVASLAAARRAAFWGHDCVAPGGLLDRCYASLRLPRRCWAGLKRLPEVGGLGPAGRGECAALAASYVAALAGSSSKAGDRSSTPPPPPPDPADLLRPLPASPSFGAAADVAAIFGSTGAEGGGGGADATAAAAVAAAAADDGGGSDSDLEADLLAERLASAALGGSRTGGGGARTPPPRGASAPGPSSPGKADVRGAISAALAQPLAGTSAAAGAAPPPPPPQPPPPPPPTRRPQPTKPVRPPPAKAVAAMWELLEGCIARPEGAGCADTGGGRGGGATATKPPAPPPPPPGAQPYDARSRTALKRVAHWLGVPWPKVAALEQLVAVELAASAEAKREGGASGDATAAAPAASAREAAAKAAKVAGATLGIGALFAVTGGLAAPVVAAGLSAAISAVGGTAAASAAAASVSGFLATSAGTALVAGGVGAGGGAFAGSRMARRVGDVQEFGFWEVRDEDGWDGGGGGGEDGEESEDDGSEGSYESPAGAAGGPSASWAGAASTSSSAPPPPPPPRPGEASSWAPEETDSHPLDGAGTVGPADDSATSALRPPPLLPPSGLGAGAGQRRRRRGRHHPRRTPTSAALDEDDPSAGPPLLPAPLSATRRPADQRLAVTVCVSGWARSRPDFLTPWRAAAAAAPTPDAERFALVWESKELIRLSAIVSAWVRNQAAQEAVKFALQHWLYAGAAVAAAGPMALVSVSNAIDSAWAMALDRAVKAGRLLAHVLMSGGAGGRPVTLVGYSMGARLVFHCLLELVRCADDGAAAGVAGVGGGNTPRPHAPSAPGAAPPPRRRVGGAGIVEHAVLLGTPVTARPERWAMARRAVSGRLLNGYCRSDWVLGVAFRASSGLVRPAGGLCPVPVPGVENVNLGAVVGGHLDYGDKVPEILGLMGLSE